MLYRRIRESSRRRIVLLFPTLLLVIAPPIQAQTDGSGLPDWLSLGFEQQSRMQVLNGQFRAGLDGDDQGFEWRNALTVNMDFESFSIETEIADMRTYFTDEDSPLDSFFTNPLDILQANVNIPVSGLFSEDDKGFIKIGRFTMDQGSRRFVARNRYRNTINSFAGVHAGWREATPQSSCSTRDLPSDSLTGTGSITNPGWTSNPRIFSGELI